MLYLLGVILAFILVVSPITRKRTKLNKQYLVYVSFMLSLFSWLTVAIIAIIKLKEKANAEKRFRN